MAEKSSADRQEAVRRPSRQRSAIVNGSTLLPSEDGRSAWVRLVRDTRSALVTHCGGEDLISETQRLSARRVSFLEAELVSIEDRLAKMRAEGVEPPDALLELYGRLSDRQRRLSEPLGWQRVARDVTPSLESIAAELTAKRTSAAPTANGEHPA